MLLEKSVKSLLALAAVCCITSSGVAQEATTPTAATPATLTADGTFAGNVVADASNKTTQVANAKVNLVSQGKVIDTVKANDEGYFSFANVNPGAYQLVGIANGLVGSKAVVVSPFAPAQPTPAPAPSVVLKNPTTVVANPTYSMAPVSSFSSGSPVGFGGGGMMGGGGRVFGGGGARGFLASPKGLLIVGGVVGGLAAIEDSSPDM